MADAVILHTNDFHNHLRPEQADRLKSLRAELGSRGLLVDAGDAVSSGNITFRPAGEPILDAMSDSGYDAMAVGNREFHFTRAGFFAKVSRARFPVLCANVRVRSAPPLSLQDSPDLPVSRNAVWALGGGLRVAVFGLTVPMITERMLSRKVSAYVFDPPEQTAAIMVQRLRPECDLLICLSHLGLNADRALAARAPEIDLIIGGHTHATLETGERVGETLIVQAGWWGKYFGSVEITRQRGRLTLAARVQPL